MNSFIYSVIYYTPSVLSFGHKTSCSHQPEGVLEPLTELCMSQCLKNVSEEILRDRTPWSVSRTGRGCKKRGWSGRKQGRWKRREWKGTKVHRVLSSGWVIFSGNTVGSDKDSSQWTPDKKVQDCRSNIVILAVYQRRRFTCVHTCVWEVNEKQNVWLCAVCVTTLVRVPQNTRVIRQAMLCYYGYCDLVVNSLLVSFGFAMW